MSGSIQRRNPRGERSLGRWLWDELESAQGDSFVSDDMCDLPDGFMLSFVLANLPNVRKVARMFEDIARNYEFCESPHPTPDHG